MKSALRNAAVGAVCVLGVLLSVELNRGTQVCGGGPSLLVTVAQDGGEVVAEERDRFAVIPPIPPADGVCFWWQARVGADARVFRTLRRPSLTLEEIWVDGEPWFDTSVELPTLSYATLDQVSAEVERFALSLSKSADRLSIPACTDVDSWLYSVVRLGWHDRIIHWSRIAKAVPVTGLLGGGIGAGIGAAVRCLRRSRHRRAGCCPACGYELSGIPANTPCPECGCRP
jgi:hypothetical protein